MSRLHQRRCAREGCRSAATPRKRFCPFHQRPVIEPIPVPARNTNEPRHQRDDFAVSVMLRDDLDQIATETFDGAVMEMGAVRHMIREIGLLRLLLERVIADGLEEGDLKALAKSAMPLIAEIGRAMRTNEQIKDGERDVIAEAIKQTLIEHGRSLKL